MTTCATHFTLVQVVLQMVWGIGHDSATDCRSVGLCEGEGEMKGLICNGSSGGKSVICSSSLMVKRMLWLKMKMLMRIWIFYLSERGSELGMSMKYVLQWYIFFAIA